MTSATVGLATLAIGTIWRDPVTDTTLGESGGTMATRASFIAALGLVSALAACGDNETSGSTTTSTSSESATTTTSISSTTTGTVSTAQLDSMLLDVGDVGASWQVGPEVTDAYVSDSAQFPCSDMALNPTIIGRLTPVTGIQFEPTDGSHEHLIEFLVAGDPQRLAMDLQFYFEGMEACAATTPTTTGAGTLTIEHFTIPELGDQRAAYILTGVESPDSTWYVRSAGVRVGSVAAEVALTEILSTPDDEPTITDGEYVRLLETAVAKLSG
jgi:hypothetical protein